MFLLRILEMINEARNAVGRHRASAAKLKVGVPNKIWLRRNSDHRRDRRVVLNEGAVKRRKRGEVLREVPGVERRCRVRAQLTGDLRGLVAILGVALLIAKGESVLAGDGRANGVDFVVGDDLFADVRERGPVEVVFGGTLPHLVKALLVVKV